MKNTKFTTWSSRSTPSNGIENETPSCHNPVSAHCVSVNKETVHGIGLIGTTCSSAGFTCRDSDQTRYDPENKIKCKDFQARFECPYNKGTMLFHISKNQSMFNRSINQSIDQAVDRSINYSVNQ